jgi:radical SAM family uncharacterized protein/radical SAM-linked protein
MLEDFLPLVAKPARYIDHEINAVHKDLTTVRTKVCLFFPDTYEVGMSHLGIRILYDILNSREDTACERVFSPWTDYEEELRAAGRPLTSLESNVPLDRFDIIGITLQYELSYSNILAGLELARIPVRSSERNDSHPVIVAGGPCAVNPGPLSDFIDVFFIGEAEEAVHELVDLKQAHKDKRGFLEAVAKREGFLVPALGPATVRRRYIKNIEAAPYPERPLLPLMKPVHDRVTVEVARGCIRGCRFCQAGIIYRPFRERSPERVKDLLEESLACTGYEELSLASLSSGDYSAIQPLIVELMQRYRDGRVSVSLPSLRVGTLTPEMIEAIAGTRKTGFTLAPEAGTERLRRVINKPVSDLDLMDAAETIFRNGWNVLKLYFMIGLPTETDEDLDGIIRIVLELLARGKRVSKRPLQINVGVSTFVPKPHTPFQWMGQAPLDEIRRKQAYLHKGLRRRGITLKSHNPETSVLEAAFARGDRSLGKVIAEAVARGCRFDGWSEAFDFRAWTAAFAKFGLDPASYAGRTFGPDDDLPWDQVRSGVTGKFLRQEYERAVSAEITRNCRTECSHCGLGCADGGTPEHGKPASGEAIIRRQEPPAQARRPASPEITTRIRMQFTKTGRVRFLSHLDLMTLFQRAATRAGIPLSFSQGFNPHPKMSFGPALSVGMESESEFLDMETDPFIDLLRITKDLNNSLPAGIRILESRIIPRNAPSLSGGIGRYVYDVTVPATRRAGLADRVAAFLSRASLMVVKDERQKDIRPCIESIRCPEPDDAAHLLITLQDMGQIKPRILDVVRLLLDLTPEESVLLAIRRTGMFRKQGESWVSPLDG